MWSVKAFEILDPTIIEFYQEEFQLDTNFNSVHWDIKRSLSDSGLKFTLLLKSLNALPQHNVMFAFWFSYFLFILKVIPLGFLFFFSLLNLMNVFSPLVYPLSFVSLSVSVPRSFLCSSVPHPLLNPACALLIIPVGLSALFCMYIFSVWVFSVFLLLFSLNLTFCFLYLPCWCFENLTHSQNHNGHFKSKGPNSCSRTPDIVF